jgi:hypothetical protein
MRINSLFKRAGAVVMAVSLGLTVSCSEDEAVLQQESSEAIEEAVTDSYYEDADDMASLAVIGEEAGRLAEDANDDRIYNACAEVTFTPGDGSTPENPFGVVVIDFSANDPDGCTDPRGNVRKGKIVIEFEGRRLTPGSVAVITFVGYEINGVKLEGTRTITNISANTEVAPKFNIVLENGVITWPDGSDATREHDLVREWHRENIPANDYMLVWGTASGENRRGVAYEMEIDENHPIRHNRFCPLPVSGIKTFVTETHTIVIDFGDGECDRLITITVDGVSREVESRRK